MLLKFHRDVTLFPNVGKLPTFRKVIVSDSPGYFLGGTPDPEDGGTSILGDADKYLSIDTA